MCPDCHRLTLVDAHVHLRRCFDVDTFLKGAFSNLEEIKQGFGCDKQYSKILVLTDAQDEHGFDRLMSEVNDEYSSDTQNRSEFSLHETKEEISLCVMSEENGVLGIVAGQQLVSQENLEILAIGTRHSFKEGRAIEDLIREIAGAGALPVVPWGFGKWVGSRGQLVKQLLRNPELPQIFLGDSANRPAFWSRPAHFRLAEEQGIKNLPGSDPLPFPSECQRTGSFGFALGGSLNLETPAQDLKRRLLDPSTTLQQFGRGETPFRFVRNQLKMQLRKLTR